MHKFTVDLSVDPQTLQRYYRQPNLRLEAETVCGYRLSIPLSNFQKFFSHQGLSGRFIVSANKEGKVVGVDRG